MEKISFGSDVPGWDSSCTCLTDHKIARGKFVTYANQMYRGSACYAAVIMTRERYAGLFMDRRMRLASS